MMEILGRANSVNVRKVAWCAAELGVPFTRSDWGRGFRPTSEPEFLALNPNATVPVIRDGDVVLYESHSIVRYLCAKHRPQWLGETPEAVGLISQWMDWSLSVLATPMSVVFQGKKVNPPPYTPEQVVAATARAKESWVMIARAMDEGTAPFGGEEFTAADFVIAPFMERYVTTIEPQFEAPVLDAWLSRCRARPAFHEHVTVPAP